MFIHRHHAGGGPCHTWPLADYVDWWETHQRQQQQQQQQQDDMPPGNSSSICGGDPSATCNSSSSRAPAASATTHSRLSSIRHPQEVYRTWQHAQQLLYLKDWHFVAEFPGYQVRRS
jgi:hypothetical protein